MGDAGDAVGIEGGGLHEPQVGEAEVGHDPDDGRHIDHVLRLVEHQRDPVER